MAIEQLDYQKRIQMKAEFRQNVRRAHQIKLGLLSTEPAVTIEMSDRFDLLEAKLAQMQAEIDQLKDRPLKVIAPGQRLTYDAAYDTTTPHVIH